MAGYGRRCTTTVTAALLLTVNHRRLTPGAVNYTYPLLFHVSTYKIASLIGFNVVTWQ